MDRKTILLIEDNELNMKLFRSLLKMDNYIVLEALDAETGMALAKKHSPDLILMDIQLPGMDGLTATSLLKQDPGLRDTPIVALTSYAMEGDQEKALAAGCTGYITKPIDTRSFLDTVAGFVKSARDQTTARSKKVLIVDDDPLNVKLLTSMISGSNYDILKAYDGEEALDVISREHPDLILLDIMMPKIDGYKVLEIVKSSSNTRDIPVILITALDSVEDKVRGMEAGADEFLNKPVNKTELLARVKSLLCLKEYQEQLSTPAKTERPFLKQNSVDESAWSLDNPCILLVEDNEKDAYLIRSILANQQYTFIHATNGEDALEFMKHNRFDLILLDVLLPNMNGFEVCCRLKELDSTKNIQVLMITCLDDLSSKLKGFDSGADDYLVKPLNRQELEVRVKVLIRKKGYLDKLSAKYENALSVAITDKLTGLYNHTYLKHYLGLEMKRSQRNDQQLALIMLDVDNFKQFNDTHGHLAGDVVLQELSSLIKKNIRDIDFAARNSGEEFSVIIPNTHRQCATLVAERIRRAINTHEFSTTLSLGINILTVSQGVAIFPKDALTMDDLIQKTEAELYRAKREGKNRVSVYGHTE
jgi:two-component system, cell cycle response regulator